MKKIIFLPTLLLLIVSLLISCGTYDPIESTEEELRVVGTIKNHNIYYDELRCSVMNAKTLMAQEYNINWDDSDDAEKHRQELESRVFEGLVYNYAVAILLAENGYGLDTPSIQDAVQAEIKQLIDECGSRAKYKKYLSENYLTDRVARFNLSISYALNELLFMLNDTGAFDEYVEFDIECINPANELYYNDEDFFEAYLMLLGSGIMLRAEDIFIPKDTPDGENIVNSIFSQAKQGDTYLSEIAEQYPAAQYETLYLFEGEYDEKFFNAVASIEEEDVTLLSLDSGWYIIHRLAPSGDYVYQNCYNLAYEYLFLKMNEHISEYEKTLTIEFTNFGKSLDITKIK